MRPTTYKVIFFIVMAVMLYGATGAFAPQKAKAEDAKEDMFELKRVIVEYTAIQEGRRDPFRSIIDTNKTDKTGEVKAPTESFDLKQMRLIGIISAGSTAYASVILPDGQSHIIKVGDKLGLRSGVITDIGPDYVVIREEEKDYKGNLVTQDVVVKLRKEEGK